MSMKRGFGFFAVMSGVSKTGFAWPTGIAPAPRASAIIASSSTCVGVFDAIPRAGISKPVTHATPFSIVVRKLSFVMFAKKWKPVKPKPRPPFGRSKAHARCCGLPAFTSAKASGLPPCGLGLSPSLNFTVFSGAMALSTGVTPFISGTKRMW